MADFAYAKDFEDGTLGAVETDVDVLEGVYVVGHDGSGGDGGLGLRWDDTASTDFAGLVLFEYDSAIATVLDSGSVGMDFVRHGPYSAGTPGGSPAMRLGHLEDGTPSRFGVAFRAMSDGSFRLEIPAGVDVTSDPALITEGVWHRVTMTWVGLELSCVVTRQDTGAAVFNTSSTMIYPPIDRALWAPYLIQSNIGETAYNLDIDNVFLNGGGGTVAVAEPVTRLYPRDDALGPMGSATRLYPPPRRSRIVGGQS